MITLDVTVQDGIPPLPLSVDITCLDNAANNQNYQSDLGFTKDFDLAPGRYTLIVHGSNAPGGNSEVTLTGTFQTGPVPKAQYTSAISIYTALFYFVI
ncbi:hypothetical protein [Flavobacterium pallidum]|uniref:Uncharacterized protein n=1 Tax=Flavobacterium pallidum TaxID=2172098 RepID=A0A2S1SGZ3_9FLAO|nr:hypothetical protein [Flavobacterium pallidum]AWI25639.1 hypothetical protein HYN49_06865 [Flavobacterium pallidum]